MQGARVYDIPDLALTGLQRAALRKSRRRRLVFGRARLCVARPDARLQIQPLVALCVSARLPAPFQIALETTRERQRRNL